MKKQTSHAKGMQLENEFAEYMKNELGWSHTRVGVHLVGKTNRKGASVDIVGKRLDERGRKLTKLGYIYYLFAGLIFLLGYLTETDALTYASLIFGGAGAIALMFSIGKNNEHVLVECKNLNTKATSNLIDKTLREIDDYKATGDKEFNFRHHYFVSANGFVETTLKYALERGIKCFVKSGDTFTEEKYWN